MLGFLNQTWNKYRQLAWWKQILLAIPLIALAVICICLFFIDTPTAQTQLKNEIKFHKEHVDDELETMINADKALEAKIAQLEDQHSKLTEKAIDNEEDFNEVMDRLDVATTDNDLAELERIRLELNARSKSRKP